MSITQNKKIPTKGFVNALRQDLKNVESLKHFTNANYVDKIIEFANIYLEDIKGQTKKYWLVEGDPYTVEMFDGDIEGFMSGNSWDSAYYSLHGHICKAGKGFCGIFTNVTSLITK
jgi:hypothetical protein